MANMAQAIRLALHYGEQNLGVTEIFGEDVGPPLGGVFTASGLLWGGNLCTLVHLTGTPHLPSIAQTEGGILFLEDVYEHPYRVERMLLQLHYAGILDAQSAIAAQVFGALD